jgi:hypothetical protein
MFRNNIEIPFFWGGGDYIKVKIILNNPKNVVLKGKHFSENQRILEVSEILQNIKALKKLGKIGKD